MLNKANSQLWHRVMPGARIDGPEVDAIKFKIHPRLRAEKLDARLTNIYTWFLEDMGENVGLDSICIYVSSLSICQY